MKRHLPPLKALVAFEAAASAKNFSEAANTLCVTQGAVSKQIKLLEEHLQARLFERQGNAIKLTEAGKNYLQMTAQALDIIEKGSETFYAEQKKEVITIDIIPSLSALWMFSRVHTFQGLHPSITIQIHSSDNPINISSQQSDIAIRCLPTSSQNPNHELLLTENLKLIASPELLDSKPIKKTEDISKHQLLQLTNRPYLWEDVFEKYTLESTEFNKTFACEHFYMLIQAVIKKLGIAFVPDFLCEELLQKGQLVNPLNISIDTQYAYYFISPNYKKNEKKVIKFKEWVREELASYFKNKS